MPTLPSPVSRADRARATRQHLIDTTINVVRTQSFGGATLFEVAKAAGVTPGALQHHFGSRAELMMDVLQTILESTDDAGHPWPEPAVPLPERAQHYVQALWSRVYEPPRFLAAWSVYFGAAGDAALQPRIAEMRAQLSRSLRQRFEQVFPESRGRPGLQAFVDLMLSSLRGMGMARLFGADNAAESAQRRELAAVIANWCAAVAAPSPHPGGTRRQVRRSASPRLKEAP